MTFKERVEIGPHVLYLGDALNVLRSIADSSVSAVICDPPYCSGAATEAGRGGATHQGLRSETIASGRFDWFPADNMTTAGLAYLLREITVEAARAVVESGSVLAFCDWRMVTSLAPAMESGGWRLRNLLAWNKGSFGCGTGFRPQHEMVIHLTKRSPEFYDMSVGNVLTTKRPKDREHPTEKPEELMGMLARVVSPVGGVVLDPFMGSGTTGVACAKLGRKFIGVEVHRPYFEIAVRRITDAANGGVQPELFA